MHHALDDLLAIDDVLVEGIDVVVGCLGFLRVDVLDPLGQQDLDLLESRRAGHDLLRQAPSVLVNCQSLLFALLERLVDGLDQVFDLAELGSALAR